MRIGPSVARAVEAAGIGLLLIGAAAYLAPQASAAWDFDAFYYAALALRHGANPYDVNALTAVAGGIEQFPFLYAPATLALFLPFTWLPLGAATLVWLGLKLALAVALVALWRRLIPRGIGLLPLAAVALFGFNAALLMDLRAGNVSIVEQLLLWLAFAHYIGDRRWPFALLVAAASIFKLFPIAFLALLLVPSRRHGPSPGTALAGLALFAVLVFLPPTLSVQWARGILTGASAERPTGEINPCALGVFDMLLNRGRPRDHAAPDLALALWVAYCVTLVALSRPALRRAWEAREPLQWVVAGSMLFALLTPRLMVYSYLLPEVGALLLIHAMLPRGRDRAVALALVIGQGIVIRAVFRADFLQNVVRLPRPADLALSNLPFFVTLGLWLGFVAGRSRVTFGLDARDAPSAPALSPRS